MTSLIAKCKRPVILTCNGKPSNAVRCASYACISDDSAIPLDLLPLQATLDFEPPSLSSALTLLAAITRANGCQVPRAVLAKAYQEHYASADFYGGITNMPDLRRCLNQVQLDCLITSKTPHSLASSVQSSVIPSMHDLQQVMENTSFVNAEIARRQFMHTQVGNNSLFLDIVLTIIDAGH